jgi:hypothetical protein
LLGCTGLARLPGFVGGGWGLVSLGGLLRLTAGGSQTLGKAAHGITS